MFFFLYFSPLNYWTEEPFATCSRGRPDEEESACQWWCWCFQHCVSCSLRPFMPVAVICYCISNQRLHSQFGEQNKEYGTKENMSETEKHSSVNTIKIWKKNSNCKHERWARSKGRRNERSKWPKLLTCRDRLNEIFGNLFKRMTKAGQLIANMEHGEPNDRSDGFWWGRRSPQRFDPLTQPPIFR